MPMPAQTETATIAMARRAVFMGVILADSRRITFPPRRLERSVVRTPAKVLACLGSRQIRIILFPGLGLADGGIPIDVPLDQIPFDLRTPNSLLWLEFEQDRNVVAAVRREAP